MERARELLYALSTWFFFTLPLLVFSQRKSHEEGEGGGGGREKKGNILRGKRKGEGS